MAGKKLLSADETSYFCEQLASIMRAGIPLYDGLSILSEDMEDTKIRGVINQVGEVLAQEKPLFAAMAEVGVFPSYAVKMVEIGSLTGRIEAVLASLADYYEQQGDMNRTIKSAVFHPLMLLLMMAAVIAVLIVKVIPMFRDIFSQFDDNAVAIVDKSINTAYSFGVVMLAVLFGVLVIAGVTALLSRIPSVSRKLSLMFSRFILTKKLAENISLSYFCSAMSMMASSGIDPAESLEYSEPLINNKKMKNKIMECRELVLKGESFTDALHSVKILPAMQSQTLRISYQSGSFDTAWRKISDYYDEETNRALNNLVTFIEPLLIGILAVVIGSVLLTIMVPLMDIMSSLN